MEELREDEVKKSVGRPKGPEKVMFRARVEPDMVDLMKRLAKEKRANAEIMMDQVNSLEAQLGFPKPESTSRDIRRLLDDVERLEGQNRALEDKVQKVARLTDNEKLILWIRKYDQFVARIKAKYPDEDF